jgi:hypothetical protein
MRPVLEARGIQSAGVGMISDPDGLRLQLLGVPGGLAGTIVPGGRMSLDPPVVHAVGLDHVMRRVSDLERSVAFYRTFFGNERPRTKDTPERVSSSSTSSCLHPAMRSFSASAIPTVSSSNSSLHEE